MDLVPDDRQKQTIQLRTPTQIIPLHQTLVLWCRNETNDDAKKNKPRWEAVSTTVEIAEEDFKCPICLDFFKQPIETPCCRQAFCKSCLEKSANNHRAEFKCPFCNKFTSQERVANPPF
ncbi:unnamed protein product [Oikopleura dioica]|uniref:RING-type domain-containing protein n=1 Tax=Oikopleura dioica TaxID=34765 RepID=E4XI72_OIKDI|nr:unnamed protein product [Oikopleura dioica]